MFGGEINMFSIAKVMYDKVCSLTYSGSNVWSKALQARLLSRVLKSIVDVDGIVIESVDLDSMEGWLAKQSIESACYKCKSHTAFNLDGAVLAVERVVVEVHHAGQGGGEPHPVRDAAVAAQPHQLVALRDVVEETETKFWKLKSLPNVSKIGISVFIEVFLINYSVL